MKKRLSIISVIVLVVLLVVCLVGCDYGDEIEFKEYGRVTVDPLESDSKEGIISTKMFKNHDDFWTFAKDAGLTTNTATAADNENEDEELPDLDEAFFETYAIVAIEHGMYDGESAKISKVMVKDTKLTVKYSRKYTESFFVDVVIDLIYVEQSLVENVTECQSVSSSVKFSFG